MNQAENPKDTQNCSLDFVERSPDPNGLITILLGGYNIVNQAEIHCVWRQESSGFIIRM